MSDEKPKDKDSKTKKEKHEKEHKDKEHKDKGEKKPKDKKEKKDKDVSRDAILRAVQNHPVIWQRAPKDRKSKDAESGEGQDEGLTSAWALVATEANVTAREAEKTWSKLASKFDSSYEDFHAGKRSASGGMECNKCKAFKSLDFYKAFLDSQRTGADGTLASSFHSLSLEDAQKAIGEGQMSKDKFLQYIGNLLGSVPAEKLADCEQQLLHVVAANAAH